MLVVEHALLLAAGTAPFLPPSLLSFLLGGGFAPLFAREDLFGERPAGQPTVELSGTILPHAYLDSGWRMEKSHHGRGLVRLLATRTAAAYCSL